MKTPFKKNKKQIILLVLILITTFSFGQQKSGNSKPGSLEKKIRVAINNDVAINNLFNAWYPKQKTTLINKIVRFASYSTKEKKIALNNALGSLVSKNTISNRERVIINEIVFNQSLTQNYLERILKGKYSTRSCKQLIVTLAKSHLEGFKNKKSTPYSVTLEDMGTITGLASGIGVPSGAASAIEVGKAIGALADKVVKSSERAGS